MSAETEGARVTIEYCTEWQYTAVAVRATEDLLAEYEDRIGELALFPSSGGVFEVAVNGELVFSKYRLDRLPEEDEVLRKVGEKLDSL